MFRTLCCSSWYSMLTLFVCGWTASTSQAVSFTVNIDTTPLVAQGAPPAPFALEFQFNDGDGTLANTITLSDFDFGGGTAIGSPTFNCSSGSGAACLGMTGDLLSTVTMSDGADAFNEFIQAFTPGTDGPLKFLLDVGLPQSEPFTPDAFSLAIFDSSGAGIPTSFFDVFVEVDLTSPVGVFAYASDPSQSPPGCPACAGIEIGIPSVEPSSVPEPTAFALLGSGLALFGARLRIRRPR